jgi:hypothetical protein
LELNLPKTLIEEISENELKLYLAMILYKAGLALSDFMYELGKHKIGFTNITEDELEEELRRIK